MKARIALEAVKEQKTIRAIASHYGIHASQVTQWKPQVVEALPARGWAILIYMASPRGFEPRLPP